MTSAHNARVHLITSFKFRHGKCFSGLLSCRCDVIHIAIATECTSLFLHCKKSIAEMTPSFNCGGWSCSKNSQDWVFQDPPGISETETSLWKKKTHFAVVFNIPKSDNATVHNYKKKNQRESFWCYSSPHASLPFVLLRHFFGSRCASINWKRLSDSQSMSYSDII